MQTVVIVMALSLTRKFLDDVLPAGAVHVVLDPALKRHHERHLTEQVEKVLRGGADPVIDAAARSTRRAVFRAAARHDTRVIGYWARPPEIGMPGILDYEPQYSQLHRRPRKTEGFDVLYEVINPERDYHLRQM